MLTAYLIRELNELAARHDRERGTITTRDAMLARNRHVRERVWALLNVPPACPTEASITGTLYRDGYRIEKVLYQSQPELWVTASVYVPGRGAGPFPAVISPCGHYEAGRMYPDYQYAYQEMARNGFVVLAYDPIGQGERRQYLDRSTGQNQEALRSTDEHSMAGQLLMLFGETLTGWMVRDGMAAIDYLLTRADVDPARVACSGHSGGGTMAMYLACCDQRIRAVAIHEGGTLHRWPVRTGRIGISDAEQNLFPGAAEGIDVCDMHVAIAPRPLLATIENYGPVFDETAAHIRARYNLLGVPDRFAIDEAKAPHSWNGRLRLANTDWLSRWAYGRPGPAAEGELRNERPEDLSATKTGSLKDEGRETIFSLIRRRASALPTARRATREAIAELLRFEPSDTPLSPRVLSQRVERGVRIEEVEFHAEPGIAIPATVHSPVRKKQIEPVLWVDESGPGGVPNLPGRTVIAIGVRGLPRTAPAPVSPTAQPRNAYAFLFGLDSAHAYACWYMNRNLLAMRVLDVIRAVDFTGARSVQAIGRGAGAVWVLLAAALDPRISSIVCEGGLLSYRALALADRYQHGAAIFVPGILNHFDLPDVAAAIRPRRVTIVAPVDAMMRPVGLDAARREYRHTRVAAAPALYPRLLGKPARL